MSAFSSTKLDGPPAAQGWAFVLLARMKTPELLPKLKRALAALETMREPDENSPQEAAELAAARD